MKDSALNIVAVSSEGPEMDAMVDPRFGRAGGFIIADIKSQSFKYIDNGASQLMAQGAGIGTAERMVEEGVEVVLSGYVGPKAFQALRAADIRVCQNVDGVTVGEALEKYCAGQLSFAKAANRQTA